MANLLPILLLGGAAVVVMGKKKKKKKTMSRPDELDGGEGGLPPEYLENEKVPEEAWGTPQEPGGIVVKVGDGFFSHVGTVESYADPTSYRGIKSVSSSAPSTVHIEIYKPKPGFGKNPIAIFKGLKPGSATLTLEHDDGRTLALNVTVE